MQSHTPNLDEYMNYKETNSCYLDGRYFNKVLSSYPGLLVNPLKIFITDQTSENGKVEEMYSVSMKQNYMNKEFPGLLKLVISTPTSRHSNLLILDYANKVVRRFEPLGFRGPFFNKINSIIQNYLSLYLDMKVSVIDIDLDTILNEQNPACVARGQRTGFCTAYIILYAYCYINKKEEFDPRDIRRFAQMIETKYGPLPAQGKEQEYGVWGNDNPNQTRNTAVGAGVGALGGLALVGGPIGILGGSLLGAGLGSTF